MTAPRIVHVVLASRSLPYARICIRTMLANSVDPIHLRLLVDDRAEQALLGAEMDGLALPPGCRVEIVPREEITQRLESRWPGLAGLRALHDGHPCWRKIVDPLVLSAPGEEIIVTDPDLMFPNRFAFEATPPEGVMMMRQGPDCLFPPAAVRAAFDLGVRLADHVDIGVAQLSAGAVDIEWLDDLIRRLEVERFRPFMHVEAIVWSAIAMEIGGRHLDGTAWHCWERGRAKRLAVALGLPGRWTLALEPLARMKCIHVSGPSKWWLKEAMETGALKELGNDRTAPTEGLPYVELTRSGYEREQRLKTTLARLGVQRLLDRGSTSG